MPKGQKIKEFVAFLFASLTLGCEAQASEYGLSLYQLGLVQPAPGYTPPPGLYFYDSYYLYTGSGNLYQHSLTKDPTRVTYQFAANLAIFAWYSDLTLFGGRLGFATTNAVGSDISSYSTPFVDAAGINRRSDVQKTAIGFADSELTALLGWQAGDQHWKLTASGFFPTGNYLAGRLAQTGLNRPAIDVKGAYTYLSHETGLEASAALGFTINAINTATDYLSGVDMHFEWSIGEHLPLGLYFGVGGYFYQQITADAGSGAAKFGSFQGRVAAVGPIITYKLKAGDQYIDLAARWYHEFAAYNRVEGDSIFATLGFPLWTPPPALAQK
ncbi:conserved hypothetical protein [Methylocella silvestris BL2]|uniref:Phenol degradation protein meta n=1 Tax=Methylocella silvestris (strain DSM 15510 / CIP 108128 / LMG 27833 / NCIMB 13906 / BL2) TaxID=395965 RepID=B8ET72_METSB|nr:transporter [Methylocella silvestris]ACK51714.1 conserved hypothetical protein [Methylocella silvestris BL2]